MVTDGHSSLQTSGFKIKGYWMCKEDKWCSGSRSQPLEVGSLLQNPATYVRRFFWFSTHQEAARLKAPTSNMSLDLRSTTGSTLDAGCPGRIEVLSIVVHHQDPWFPCNFNDKPRKTVGFWGTLALCVSMSDPVPLSDPATSG